MTKNLMLVEKKSYKAKITGDTKFKYIFLDANDMPFVGYSDFDVLNDRLTSEETFNSAHAHEYEVTRDVFGSEMVSRVQIEE